jgi:hypothetical protein
MEKIKQKIKQRDLQVAPATLRGFKYFKKLSKMLQHLHNAGCQRDHAGNRILHMDQYMTLLLLCMFSPISKTLRSLQQASELKKVQKKLAVPRSSLGSLSEAARVFDSDLLIEIIDELAADVKSLPHSSKLDETGAILTIVDGTLLKALPRTVEALWGARKANSFKVHLQYELLKAVPVNCQLTAGRANENAVLAANLQSGRFYVLDRGYAKYELLQRIIDAKSNFACRIDDYSVFEIMEERQLDSKSLQAGIHRDMLVRLGCQSVRDNLKQPVRVIKLKTTEFSRYSSQTLPYHGRRPPETMLICTDRLDLDADVIALIYRCRWQIEIFFRFLKHVLGCRHLLSYCDNGIELQTYAAIIACLLIALYTGRPVTLRTYEMFCWYLMGWADEDELKAHIERLRKQAVG